MGTNDSEVLETLRGGRVGNVKDDTQVVSDGSHLALEGARQGALGQFKLKAEVVVAPWHDGKRPFLMFVWKQNHGCVLVDLIDAGVKDVRKYGGNIL